MKKISLILMFLSIFSCKNEKEKTEESTPVKIVYTDSIYTLNFNFEIGDSRRYGVEPGKGIGHHPKLAKDKLEVLLDIAESGIELYFPKGIYNRTLNIENRTGVKINSDSALFTGAITIKNSSDIQIDGAVQSLTSFYVRNSNIVDLNTVIIKTDTLLQPNGFRSTGFVIHGGSNDLTVKKIVIEDSGSGGDNYNFIKGGFIVHGHNNEPRNIKIDSVIVESSDRHGAYITGEDVDVKYLNVKKFGIGTANNMVPMEGGIEGEQKDFSGLWVKNCHDCYIDEAIIDLEKSKGKYSVNFDIGEEFRPTTIGKLTIKNSNSNKYLTKRLFSRTGVIWIDLIEE